VQLLRRSVEAAELDHGGERRELLAIDLHPEMLNTSCHHKELLGQYGAFDLRGDRAWPNLADVSSEWQKVI